MRGGCAAVGMLAVAGVAYGAVPALAAAFVPSDAGMVVSILLLYVLYPSLSMVFGVASAQAMRSLWWMPGVFAGLFLPLFCFSMGASSEDMWLYAIGYAAIGYVAAAMGFALARGRRTAP